MFDLSRITDAISSFMSSGAAQTLPQAAAVPELLGNLGIDPALLDGLNQSEVLQLLEQHGIDPSALDATQLTELFQYAGAAQPLIDIAQAWLEYPER